MEQWKEVTYTCSGLGVRRNYNFLLPRTVAGLASCNPYCTTDCSPVLAFLTALSQHQGTNWKSTARIVEQYSLLQPFSKRLETVSGFAYSSFILSSYDLVQVACRKTILYTVY